MIQQFTPDDVVTHVQSLCYLLNDAVDSGASIGFLPPLSPIEALTYWDTVRVAVHEGSRVLIASLDGDAVLGAVQLDLCTRANGTHRAEVCKLMVHREARRQGIGAMLMRKAEEAAQHIGRTLLVLDTRKGDSSEALYRKLGYIAAGEIPQYARSARGELHPTVFFYRLI